MIWHEPQSNPIFHTQRCSGFRLTRRAEWPVCTDYFDGATISGLIPQFFVASPDEALEALNSDLAKAFKDLQCIYSRLFMTENILASDAWNFMGNPR